MATVSINRIIKAEDKIVLAQEYGNIINNLDLSKIKPDPEITKIYTEILNLITSKILIKEETRFIRANYDKRVQNGIVEAITSLSVTSLINPQEFLEVLARECISTYFDYQFHHDDLREEMNRDLWRLKSEDIQAVNNIRKQQLESVWSLLYKYRDASGSRLVDLDIDYFYQAVNEPDNTKRLTDFRILEKKLKSYPPYWFYRAQSARIANKNEEYQSCLASFDEVWQPVLIEDPYKLEVCKYRFQDLMNSGRSLENIRDEALSYLDAAKENTPFEDWANNLFIGLAYYVLGEYEKGIAQVSVNVNFKHDDGLPIDTMYSPSILRQMTAGNDDIITFVSKLTEFIKHYSQEWKNSKLESKLDEKIEQNFHENTKYQWDERFFQDNEKLVKAQDYFVEGIARITRGFRLSTNWGGVFDKIQNDIYSSFRPEYEAFMKNFQAEYSPISQENISFLDIADKLEDKRLNLLWPALESQLSNPWTAFIILVAGVLIITFKNLVTNKLFPVFNYKGEIRYREETELVPVKKEVRVPVEKEIEIEVEKEFIEHESTESRIVSGLFGGLTFGGIGFLVGGPLGALVAASIGGISGASESEPKKRKEKVKEPRKITTTETRTIEATEKRTKHVAEHYKDPNKVTLSIKTSNRNKWVRRIFLLAAIAAVSWGSWKLYHSAIVTQDITLKFLHDNNKSFYSTELPNAYWSAINSERN